MGFTHGTRTAMRNYNCHCEDCRAGAALAQRSTRQRRQDEGAFRCPICQSCQVERWRLERHLRTWHHTEGA